LKRSYTTIYFTSIALLLLMSCAVIKPRTGGDKDTKPPVDSIYSPVNLSTHFDGNKFSIQFDEYIQTKDVQNQLVISPPLNTNPVVRIKKKTLHVSWVDTLKENTTYSFNFGESVADYNEGNIARNLTYVFSTGAVVDSLQIKGTVRDAYTQEPLSDVRIMVYRNLADSACLTEKPYYLAISDELGEYTVNYMSAGTYKIVALADENKDYLVTEGEAMAFAPSELILQDSTLHLADLQLSKPKPSVQYITDYSRDSTGFVKFNFLVPPDSIELSVLGYPETQIKSYFDTDKDTLFAWTTGSPLEKDLEINVRAAGGVNDTITIQHYTIDKTGKSLKMNLSTQGKIAAHDSLFLLTERIITQIDTNSLAVLLKDSLEVPLMIKATSDPRKYFLDTNWGDNSTYHVSIDPKKFKSVEGLENDSLKFEISTYNVDHYGRLNLTIENLQMEQYSYILQIENKNGKIIREVEVGASLLQFKRLLPGTYKIRLIVDRNKNGIWDPVDYINKEQPERLFYFPKEFNMRSNWENDFNWILDEHE
jgi:hypothetical protein